MSNKIKSAKPLIVANWKMNGYQEEAEHYLRGLHSKTNGCQLKADIVVCPPYTLLKDFCRKASECNVKIGAQNCHDLTEGAHTGSISAGMVKDSGCEYVILGHSERRTTRNEGSELVNRKAISAHEKNLKTIICVGETIYERENDLASIVVREQVIHSVPKTATIDNTIVAYEPVWAIGTGKVPSSDDIEKMHTYIKQVIEKEVDQLNATPKVIYGGSVKSSNSEFVLKTENVDGLLVGKASLDIEEFWKIIESSS